MSAAPDAFVTRDESHGTIVHIPIAPTAYQHQQARKTRRRVILLHTIAEVLVLVVAVLLAPTLTRLLLAGGLMLAVAVSSVLSTRYSSSCQPQPRWVVHTERDLPGLAALIGPDPTHFTQAMREVDPQRYNARTLAAAIDQLVIYRDEWTSTLGSVLKADQLRADLVHDWQPVRDAGPTTVHHATRVSIGRAALAPSNRPTRKA